MRRMEKVTGRSDDMLIIRGVNVFPTQIEELVLAEPDLAGHYQIELTREGRLDMMTGPGRGAAGGAREHGGGPGRWPGRSRSASA